MEPTAKPEPGTLFVSCNPKEGPVTRWGIPTRPGSFVYIGAERSISDPKVVEYHPEEIVMIPASEAETFVREYQRAINSKALLVRSLADYQKQQADYAREIETAEARAKEAKEAAEKAASDAVAAAPAPGASSETNQQSAEHDTAAPAPAS